MWSVDRWAHPRWNVHTDNNESEPVNPEEQLRPRFPWSKLLIIGKGTLVELCGLEPEPYIGCPCPKPTHAHGFWVGMGSILLCIPASNSSSEANFSDARHMLTKKRSELRASPVALHLHLHSSFFIRNADVDGRRKPNGPCKLDFGMKSLARTIADHA